MQEPRKKPGKRRPPITVDQVLAWADAHHGATGRWPSKRSGRILESAYDEDWHSINRALIRGFRTLPAGLSLHKLFQTYRGVEARLRPEQRQIWALDHAGLLAERRKCCVILSVERVVAWADAYHAELGRWPTFRSGPIAAAPGETWSTINAALRNGRRGLPGPTTLTRLLIEHRGRPGAEQASRSDRRANLALGRWLPRGTGAVARREFRRARRGSCGELGRDQHGARPGLSRSARRVVAGPSPGRAARQRSRLLNLCTSIRSWPGPMPITRARGHGPR